MPLTLSSPGFTIAPCGFMSENPDGANVVGNADGVGVVAARSTSNPLRGLGFPVSPGHARPLNDAKKGDAVSGPRRVAFPGCYLPWGRAPAWYGVSRRSTVPSRPLLCCNLVPRECVMPLVINAPQCMQCGYPAARCICNAVNELAKTQGRITELEDEIAAENEDITNLENELAELGGEIAVVRNELVALET